MFLEKHLMIEKIKIFKNQVIIFNLFAIGERYPADSIHRCFEAGLP